MSEAAIATRAAVEPRRIFGLTVLEHKPIRVREILRFYNVQIPTPATKAQLLGHLISIEEHLSVRERGAISPWLRGAGLLSDLRPMLRRAQVLDKQIARDPTPSNTKPEADCDPLMEEQECSVCLIEYNADAFPRTRLSTRCRHTPHVCLECLKQSLEIQIRDKPCDLIACPECPANMSYGRVKMYTSPETFELYDQKHTLAVLQAMPNFIMCSSPSCNSGQIHECGTKEPIVRCAACDFRTCFVHKIPWHVGFSCREYDKYHRDRKTQELASAQYLKRFSKICPNPKCGLHVQKINGCDHIYCTHCHFEFCWACLAAYDRIRKEGNTAHADQCQYHTGQLNRRPAPVPMAVQALPPRRPLPPPPPPPQPRPQPIEQRQPAWVARLSRRTARV